MKKLLYCFALFAVTSIVCLIVAYGITRYSVRQEQAVPNTVIETETVNDVDDRAAMNQEQVKPILESVSPAEEYYLVSESGFLLVFCSDRSTICLYTHIPVTDSGKGEGEADGGHMVSVHDGCIPLFGIVYKLSIQADGIRLCRNRQPARQAAVYAVARCPFFSFFWMKSKRSSSSEFFTSPFKAELSTWVSSSI